MADVTGWAIQIDGTLTRKEMWQILGTIGDHSEDFDRLANLDLSMLGTIVMDVAIVLDEFNAARPIRSQDPR